MSHILISEIWVSETSKLQDLSNLAVFFLTTTNINTSSECQQRCPTKCFPLGFFSWWVSKSALMHQFSLKSFTNTSRIYKNSTVIGNKALTDVFLCPQRKQLFVEFRIMKSSLTYRLWTTTYWLAQCVSTILVSFHSFKAYQTISLHFPEQSWSHRCWNGNRRQIH